MRQNETKQTDSNKNYISWIGIGVEFCGVMGLCSYIGYKLDERWNTSPWFLLIGFFTGFIGMFYLIVKRVWNIRK